MITRFLVAAFPLLVACTSARQPAVAAVEPSAAPRAASPVADTTRRGYTDADVRFMQEMIGHHAQALTMSALVPSRTARDNLKLLAERITISQRDEIARMERWLRTRGEEIPTADAHAHHAGHHPMMPGMLSPEEMARLEQATGAEFDRLFVEGMIKHHEGALVMVEQLYASPGGGQEPELYLFANDVDADQRAEIKRMRALLEQLK